MSFQEFSLPGGGQPGEVGTLEALITAARTLLIPGERHFLGITGAPGSGKSTPAQLLQAALGHDAVLVPIDGFHLANAELGRLDRHARKSAPDTFDAAGYINTLRRLQNRTEQFGASAAADALSGHFGLTPERSPTRSARS